MSVQSVQDNGLVKGTIDLADHVTVGTNGKSATITTEEYLSAQSPYDASESPNKRLAHVLDQASRLPISSRITSFVNDQTNTWNTNHSTAVAAGGNSEAAPCPQGTTLVDTSRSVTEHFCIYNEATLKVKGQYPTWREARDFCEAAGGFLLTYEQQSLGTHPLFSSVRDSGGPEWILRSIDDNREGLVGPFFGYIFRGMDTRAYYIGPDQRYSDIAFRCGGFPSPQYIDLYTD